VVLQKSHNIKSQTMTASCQPTSQKTTTEKSWNRLEVAKVLDRIAQSHLHWGTLTDIAEESGVPRTTVIHWKKRKESIDHESEVVDFFESAIGVAFLQQMMVAVTFVLTQIAGGGIRSVSLFLQLSRLDRFVGSSYGAQQNYVMQMERIIGDFGQEERERLASKMPAKRITVCQDETFHPKPCLLAIEPISNFIIMEQYAEKRDAATWNQTMDAALKGLNVKVFQSTGDEAMGLINHAVLHLGAHHSPDLMHVQQELSRATQGPLAAQTRHYEKEHDKMCKKVQKKATKAEKSRKKVDLIAASTATGERNLTQLALENSEKVQEESRETIKALGENYHPFDLKTGAPRSSNETKKILTEPIMKLRVISAKRGLSEKTDKRINKASRVVEKMIATILFFFCSIHEYVRELNLSPDLESLIHSQLIPSYYIEYAANKAKDPETRKNLAEKATELRRLFNKRDGPWCKLSDVERERVTCVAKECAGVFQRSSSCVEGRNGQLSLWHHGRHSLSKRKLQALTTIHNYFTLRCDGTTAAERFFAAKPRDMYDYLLKHMPLPVRPARSRAGGYRRFSHAA
jgi:uncharacterized protein YqkB|tara:strand:- start:162 stop:1883 length:1722 start_codon:yes stop_codon:yes gene_type:complete